MMVITMIGDDSCLKNYWVSCDPVSLAYHHQQKCPFVNAFWKLRSKAEDLTSSPNGFLKPPVGRFIKN
jgi:hypothetical protein